MYTGAPNRAQECPEKAYLFKKRRDLEQFANDLMQAVQMITKMRDQEFDKLLNYDILLQDNIAGPEMCPTSKIWCSIF
jgi:hypothetical protein